MKRHFRVLFVSARLVTGATPMADHLPTNRLNKSTTSPMPAIATTHEK